MDPNLVDRLRNEGLTVELENGHLNVSPRDLLTHEFRDLILTHQEQIREELRREELKAQAVSTSTDDPHPELCAGPSGSGLMTETGQFQRPGKGTCSDCGRKIGPAANICGICRRARTGHEIRRLASLQILEEMALEAWRALLNAINNDESLGEGQLPERAGIALTIVGGLEELEKTRQGNSDACRSKTRSHFVKTFVDPGTLPR